MSTDDQWWRTAVIYQIYIRSFADGDGTGDLIPIALFLVFQRMFLRSAGLGGAIKG